MHVSIAPHSLHLADPTGFSYVAEYMWYLSDSAKGFEMMCGVWVLRVMLSARVPGRQCVKMLPCYRDLALYPRIIEQDLSLSKCCGSLSTAKRNRTAAFF